MIGEAIQLACFTCFAPGPGAPGVNPGIVMLMAAPYAVFVSIAVVLYRNYRREAARSASDEGED